MDMKVSQLGNAKTNLLHSDNTCAASPNRSETLIRLPEVRKRTGLSRATIYRLIAAGQFPRQVKLSLRASGWADSAVSAWIAARLNCAA